MGGLFGGGGGGKSTSTSYTSSLPEYAEPYYKDLMTRTSAESQAPYQAYQGQRNAQFNPDSLQAFQQVGDIARGAPGSVQDVGYQAGDIGTQSMEGRDLSGYMNPYLQQTLNVQNQMAQRRFAEQGGSRAAQAIQAGAFGGTRGAVQESLAQRDFNEQSMAREAQAMQSGYQNAQQMFTSDQQRALQAAQSQEAARRGAADIRMRGVGQQQRMGLEAAQALSNVGTQRQAQTQRGLDTAYTDFINQRDYPRQQLAFYSQILQGMPVTPQSEVSTPAASPLSQIAGAGTAAYGLSQMS